MKFILIVLIVQNLFAYTAKIKKDVVWLRINDKVQEYKKNDTFNLSQGDIICFDKGNGKVIIKGKGYKKKLSKRNKLCKVLPIYSKKSKNYITMVSSKISTLYSKSNEDEIDGVSRSMSNDNLKLEKKIFISKEKKYIMIDNTTFGPLPIKLEVLDKHGNLISSDLNEDNTISSFIIPTNIIPIAGCTIKISNFFDDVLVNTEVDFVK